MRLFVNWVTVVVNLISNGYVSSLRYQSKFPTKITILNQKHSKTFTLLRPHWITSMIDPYKNRNKGTVRLNPL